jgi:uncharacterized protein YqgC (DUF456 family)
MTTTIAVTAVMLIVAIAGFALTLLTLSGAWLIVLAALLIDLYWQETYSTTTLIALGVLSLIGEALEIGTAGVAARRAGGTRSTATWSVVGGLLGGIVGTFVIPLPVIGTIVGAAIGSGLLASASHRGDGYAWSEASRVGGAAFGGRLLATILKSLMTLIVAILAVTAAAIP